MRLLKPGGTMILSHPGIGEVPVQDKTVVVDSRSYGEAHLTKFLRLEN
jgi:16S rRNA (guanine966-N2)-methyltransferase